LSPAFGIVFDSQVEGSDQFPLFTVRTGFAFAELETDAIIKSAMKTEFMIKPLWICSGGKYFQCFKIMA
jgi:hypothetical protein